MLSQANGECPTSAMESFARVFPLDWTTVEYVSAVVGLIIVVLCLLAFLLRRSRHRHEQHSRTAA